MPFYYAVQLPTFQPAMRNILSISQSNPAVIVTTFDGINPGINQYLTGLIVRITIPAGFGMSQFPQGNDAEFPITVIDATSFSLPVDTTMMDPFIVPAINPGHFYTPAQVTPGGEVNSTFTSATRNVLPYP